jgi:hypothetical protein
MPAKPRRGHQASSLACSRQTFRRAIDWQPFGRKRYDRWREFDPEDSLRFYTLRMQEMGMIKSRPQKVIADGTDWRFLDDLKRELKM